MSSLKLFDRSQADGFDGPSHPLRPNPLPTHQDHHLSLKSRFPSWLHHKIPQGSLALMTDGIIHQNHVHTVCEQARCPNLTDCYSKKTATFLAMGKQCTRRCGFCSIEHASMPDALDDDEPERISQTVQHLGLKHVVITQVARDDLPDGGALHMSRIITHLRKTIPSVTIEVLTSDFQGNQESLKIIMNHEPEVFNHNLETVKRLSSRIRHQADYQMSLTLLLQAKKLVKGKTRYIKSGLMVGLGETDEEIREALHDLKEHGADIVTIGQYLQSSRQGFLVKRFVHPDTFKLYEQWGHELGISHMYCAPFVRSSYNASLFVET